MQFNYLMFLFELFVRGLKQENSMNSKNFTWSFKTGTDGLCYIYGNATEPI